jgi:hypothetical protein
MVDSDHAIGNPAQKIGCKITLHDLRRTFLTTAEKLGLSFVVLKKLANHSGGNDLGGNFGESQMDLYNNSQGFQASGAGEDSGTGASSSKALCDCGHKCTDLLNSGKLHGLRGGDINSEYGPWTPPGWKQPK